jgi:hypothetical protein
MPPETFPTLLEAVKEADAAVEFNEAAPFELRTPATVVGTPEVVFGATQIYLLCELARQAAVPTDEPVRGTAG